MFVFELPPTGVPDRGRYSYCIPLGTFWSNLALWIWKTSTTCQILLRHFSTYVCCCQTKYNYKCSHNILHVKELHVSWPWVHDQTEFIFYRAAAIHLLLWDLWPLRHASKNQWWIWLDTPKWQHRHWADWTQWCWRWHLLYLHWDELPQGPWWWSYVRYGRHWMIFTKIKRIQIAYRQPNTSFTIQDWNADVNSCWWILLSREITLLLSFM